MPAGFLKPTRKDGWVHPTQMSAPSLPSLGTQCPQHLDVWHLSCPWCSFGCQPVHQRSSSRSENRRRKQRRRRRRKGQEGRNVGLGKGNLKERLRRSERKRGTLVSLACLGMGKGVPFSTWVLLPKPTARLPGRHPVQPGPSPQPWPRLQAPASPYSWSCQ